MNETIESELVGSYIRRGYWKDRTLGDFVSQRAQAEGDRIALVDQSNTLTYRELDEASSRVAGLLARNGVEEGDRVLFPDEELRLARRLPARHSKGGSGPHHGAVCAPPTRA